MKKLQVLTIVSGLLLAGQLLSQPGEKLILQKINEPSEKAFSILKPKGWLTEGGIVRWDPIASGGPANCIESKIDFAIKKDQSGTIQIRWLPEIYFDDPRGSLVAGMFPEGSNYNGMPVLYKMNATKFLEDHVFPYLHPGTKLSPQDSKELPEIVKLCYALDIVKELGSKYYAAVSDFVYTENGIKYLERIFCIIQDMGPYTAGMWKNRNTVAVRAPETSFATWEPLFHEIGQSVRLNPEWMRGELIGQMQRGSTMIKTMQDVARLGEEIQKMQAQTNSQINQEAYLNLTAQEDYVNPYTNQVERGTNQWDHRWVDNQGNVIYTNNNEYNPNIDPELQMDGFRRSQIKKQ